MIAYACPMIGTAAKSLSSETTTNGIRVRAEPDFVDSHSDAEKGRFVFSYKVQMTNEGSDPIRLNSRRWHIVDADGTRNEVIGPGVVGKFPNLAPGETFEYSSYCILPTPWGTMEGHFIFDREDGSTVEAQVARFYLATKSS